MNINNKIKTSAIAGLAATAIGLASYNISLRNDLADLTSELESERREIVDQQERVDLYRVMRTHEPVRSEGYTAFFDIDGDGKEDIATYGIPNQGLGTIEVTREYASKHLSEIGYKNTAVVESLGDVVKN